GAWGAGLTVNAGGEPLADRHARAAGRLARGLPRPRVDALHMPRRQSHTSTRIPGSRTRSNPAGRDSVSVDRPWGRAGRLPPVRLFPSYGKHAVKSGRGRRQNAEMWSFGHALVATTSVFNTEVESWRRPKAGDSRPRNDRSPAGFTSFR